MSLLWAGEGPRPAERRALELGAALVKEAAEPAAPRRVVYNLAGTLQRLPHGAVVVSVPAALVRGIFAALHEPGVTLPTDDGGAGLAAYIVVFRPDEVEALGGPDRISERGKQYHYALGRLMTAESDQPGVQHVFYLRVHSPELQELRRSYGLSSLPGGGLHDFHVVVAVRRRGVLGRNDTSKTDGAS